MSQSSSSLVLIGEKCFARRYSREALNDACVLKTVKHGGRNVMVWGCFSRDGLGILCRVTNRLHAEEYIKLCEANILPLFRAIFGSSSLRNKQFQQDGAPCHT
eukprot:GCRY01006418.1.p3 GENE.GCRY01006418.1~~GCRY01006418.1.p3  ORF type:complete len:103 (+),score=12.74 GCRY01006418.1:697-1005(+)